MTYSVAVPLGCAVGALIALWWWYKFGRDPGDPL